MFVPGYVGALGGKGPVVTENKFQSRVAPKKPKEQQLNVQDPSPAGPPPISSISLIERGLIAAALLVHSRITDFLVCVEENGIAAPKAIIVVPLHFNLRARSITGNHITP